MARELTNELGAVTAGTPATRSARLALGSGYPYKWFDRIGIDNRSGQVLVVTINSDDVRRVGVDSFLPIDKETVGPIYFYSIDPAANISANTVTVYELPGSEDPITDADRSFIER